MKKIANSDIIKELESELIYKINSSLDKSKAKQILEQQHNIQIDGDVEFKYGNIVIHNMQKTFKLVYNASLSVSLLLDPEGNYIPHGKIEEVGSQFEEIIEDYIPQESLKDENIHELKNENDVTVNDIVESAAKSDMAVNDIVENAAKSDMAVNDIVESAAKGDMAVNDIVENAAKSDMAVNDIVESAAKSDMAVNDIVENAAKSDMAVNDIVESAAKSDVEKISTIKNNIADDLKNIRNSFVAKKFEMEQQIAS